MSDIILTVSEITKKIRYILESNLYSVTVIGEISNFKKHSSGHIYFTLKDETASLNAVLWRSRANFLSFTPLDGMKVIASGSITVYETRGVYQLDVVSLKPAGTGELQIAFEKLKQKLAAEGLFDTKYKKPIPRFPKRIGIVTSPTGAAIRDIYNIISRRYPVVELTLYPVNVQGAGAAEEISNAIKDFNKLGNVDVLIVGRGGGSLEDLWAFNEEIVARAIFESKIPIVSAVGHEIDFTIADFVADLRAPTPSAAAEIVVPNVLDLIENISDLVHTMNDSVSNSIRMYKDSIDSFISSYRFNLPLNNIKQLSQKTDELDRLLNLYFINNFKERTYNLKRMMQVLSSLNPDSILNRGYAIIYKDSQIIDRGLKLKSGDDVGIKFKDKKVDAKIN